MQSVALPTASMQSLQTGVLGSAEPTRTTRGYLRSRLVGSGLSPSGTSSGALLRIEAPVALGISLIPGGSGLPGGGIAGPMPGPEPSQPHPDPQPSQQQSQQSIPSPII